MTVEELNVKISADAENFKNEIAAANQAMTIFRTNCINAGKDAVSAFDGLITTDITAVQTDNAAASHVTANADLKPAGIPTSVPTKAYTRTTSQLTASRAAVVPELDSSETVVGAAGGSGYLQPVNITTTVELDGDKVGEAVNRFNLRRNTITNGLYS